MSNNEQKRPMQFFTDKDVAKKNKSMEDLVNAIKFGVPTLGDKLCEIYAEHGLCGLRKIEKIIDDNFINQKPASDESEDDETPTPFNEGTYTAEEWED